MFALKFKEERRSTNNRCQQFFDREERDFIQNIDINRPSSSSSLPLWTTTIVINEKKAPTTPKHTPDLGGREREKGKVLLLLLLTVENKDAHLVHVDSLLRFGLDGNDPT